MPEAWSEAVQEAGGKQPTAKQVQAVVERRKQTGLSREPLPLMADSGWLALHSRAVAAAGRNQQARGDRAQRGAGGGER